MNSNIRTSTIKVEKIPQWIAQLFCGPLCEACLGLSMKTELGTEPGGPSPSPKAWFFSSEPAMNSLTPAHSRAAVSVYCRRFLFFF